MQPLIYSVLIFKKSFLRTSLLTGIFLGASWACPNILWVPSVAFTILQNLFQMIHVDQAPGVDEEDIGLCLMPQPLPPFREEPASSRDAKLGRADDIQGVNGVF